MCVATAANVSAMKRYRFSVIGAALAELHGHPETLIRMLAPEATDLDPVAIADCWLFRAPDIELLPSYVVEVED